jgi:hypothetical protein
MIARKLVGHPERSGELVPNELDSSPSEVEGCGELAQVLFAHPHGVMAFNFVRQFSLRE